MNCNKCGTVNPEGTNFCVNCGNNLNSVATPTPVVPEVPELPGLATPAPVEMPAPAAPAVEPTPVAPAPVVPAPVAQAEPVVPAAPVVEEPTGPLLEPITQPQLAPNLLATQVLPTVTPEAPAPAPVMEPVAPAPVPTAPVTPTPVMEPTPVAPAPVAPTPVVPAQPTIAPVAPQVAPVAPTPKKGMNKKILIPIIAVAAVALIVVALLVVPKFFGGSGADELAKAKIVLDTDRPIPIEEDGKYGFISSKGKVIIEPKYESVGDFYGDYAVVAVESDDDIWDYQYQVINQKGKEQLKEAVYLEPEYYPEYGIWVIDGKLYNEKLKQTSAEGEEIDYIGQGYLTYSNMDKNKSGIMTASGKKIWSWDGWSIDASISENEYGDDDLYATVNSYLDDEQEVIVSLKKKKIVYELEDRENHNIMEEDNGVFEIYNTDTYDTHTYLYFCNGKLAYESKDSELEGIEIYDYEKQIIQLYYGYDEDYDSVYKYYDAKKGKEVDKSTLEEKDEYEDEDLYELKYGFKPFESSYKYGIIAGDQILVQSKYEDVHFLEYNIFLYMKEVKNKELALFETEKEMILMNVKNQKEIAKFDADYVGMSQTSSFLNFSHYYETDKYIVYNLITGEQKEFDEDVEIELGSNYITVEDDDKITYYNTKLESIYTVED